MQIVFNNDIQTLYLQFLSDNSSELQNIVDMMANNEANFGCTHAQLLLVNFNAEFVDSIITDLLTPPN